MVLFKPRAEGGLGVHHAKSKACAILLKSFVKTALGKKFIRNHYHNTLFKWYVLGQRNFTDPGSPPYYSADFFTIIREVLENDQPRITRMTSVDIVEEKHDDGNQGDR